MTDFPPGYIAQIERAAELSRRWCAERPGPGLPDLRFRDMGPKVIFTGNLDAAGQAWLGLTPDAMALIRYVDAETAHQLTIFQMTCALRFAGFLPR